MKKQPWKNPLVAVRIPPELVWWLDAQEQSRAEVIERLLRQEADRDSVARCVISSFQVMEGQEIMKAMDDFSDSFMVEHAKKVATPPAVKRAFSKVMKLKIQRTERQ